MERFDIPADKLAALYADLKCDGCGRALTPSPEIWAKVGCGYFCAKCLSEGRHEEQSCALRHS